MKINNTPMFLVLISIMVMFSAMFLQDIDRQLNHIALSMELIQTNQSILSLDNVEKDFQ